MALGEKVGLDPEIIHHVLNQGAGMFEKRGEMMVKLDYRDGDLMVFNIFRKDAAVIKEFSKEMGRLLIYSRLLVKNSTWP